MAVVYGIVLGGEELYGYLDDAGNFYEAPPSGFLHEVERLTDSIGLIRGFGTEIIDTAGETIARVEIGVVNGRIACTGIQALAGKELTGQLLRQAPLAKLVKEAAKANIVHLRDGFAVRFAQGGFSFTHENDIPQSPGRQALSDEFLTKVASIYRQALAAGESPALAVEHLLGPTTPENARRWIMRSREAGFLGESLGQGKKGELSPHTHPGPPSE